MKKLPNDVYHWKIFMKLARHLIHLREDVGHYDDKSFSIVLYDAHITGKELKTLHSQIEQITNRYRYVVLSPGETYSNLRIEYTP